MINEFLHLNPSITSGNQKWNGAAPIFVRREEFIIINMNGAVSRLLGNLNWDIKSVIDNNKMDEATAWVIKYLSAASLE